MTADLFRASRGAVQVLTRDGVHLAAGRASLFVAREIGFYPRLARLAAKRPLVWAVEAGYQLVARHRGFFGRFLFRGIGPRA